MTETEEKEDVKIRDQIRLLNAWSKQKGETKGEQTGDLVPSDELTGGVGSPPAPGAILESCHGTEVFSVNESTVIVTDVSS